MTIKTDYKQNYTIECNRYELNDMVSATLLLTEVLMKSAEKEKNEYLATNKELRKCECFDLYTALFNALYLKEGESE